VLTSAVVQTLTAALDTAALRQRTIAHNIANLNTPGFKRYQVSFPQALQKAQGLPLRRTDLRHLPAAAAAGQPLVTRDESTGMRADGNNVDIDREMVELAQNGLDYQFAARQVSGRLAMLSYVINEGRR